MFIVSEIRDAANSARSSMCRSVPAGQLHYPDTFHS
jgi:hypothetical protein